MTNVEPSDNTSATNNHGASVADARTPLDAFTLPLLRPFWSHLITVSNAEPRATILPGTVSIATTDGVIYQLQTSPDLTTWTDEGAPVTGNGFALNAVVTFSGPRKFWRWLVSW